MVGGGGKDKVSGSGGAILTRRNLLELAGLAFASTAIPPGVVAARAAGSQTEAALGVSPVMDKLSGYMSEAGERALPDEVVEKAKHHILDTLAAMISGSEIRPGRAAIEFVRAYGGKEVAATCSRLCVHLREGKRNKRTLFAGLLTLFVTGLSLPRSPLGNGASIRGLIDNWSVLELEPS